MSQQTSVLSELQSQAPLSPATLAYLGQRARNRYYDYIIKRLRASGMKKADLARRIGKGPDRIGHLLGSPGNWTIDTIAELLAGIAQEELLPDSQKIEGKAARNITQADLVKGIGSAPTERKAPSATEADSSASAVYFQPPVAKWTAIACAPSQSVSVD